MAHPRNSRKDQKYYWIFLHQLAGRFADHLPRTNWNDDRFPPSDDLQGIALRKIDPTDIRAYAEAPNDNVNWVVDQPYSFPSRDNPDEDREWIANPNDFVDMKYILTVNDSDETLWHLLDLSISWTGPNRSEDGSGAYRHVSRTIKTAFCDSSSTARIRSGFKQADWPIQHLLTTPEDYRGYLGEYPSGLGYAKRPDNEIRYAKGYNDFTIYHSAFCHLKGAEWEYDYSSDVEVPSLIVPSPSLIKFGGLKWDGRGSWLDSNGVAIVRAVNWYGNSVNALIARQDFVDEYLTDRKMAMLITGFQQKFIAGTFGDSPGINEQFSVYLRASKRVWTLGVKVETRL